MMSEVMQKTEEPLAIKLVVRENQGVRHEKTLVGQGVPIRRGLLMDPAHMALVHRDGHTLPFQCRPLAWWPDGSVKWLFCEFLLSMAPHTETTLLLQRKPTPPGTTPCLEVREDEQRITVRTSGVTFTLHRQQELFFSSDQFSPRVMATDTKGREIAVGVKSCSIEERGGLSCRIIVRGVLRFGRKKRLEVTVRHFFHGGAALVRSELVFHNPAAALHPGGMWDLGDPGSLFFRGVEVRLARQKKVEKITWQVSSQEQVCSMGPSGRVTVYQDSSGGENWLSANHLDRDGNLTTRLKGFEVRIQDEQGKNRTLTGDRALPWVQLQAGDRATGVTVQEFWQNFPTSLSADGQQIRVGLFPTESGQFYEMQGGEQKRQTIHLFHGPSEAGPVQLLAVHAPLTVLVDPAAIEESGAIPFFVAEPDEEPVFRQYIRQCVEGPDAFTDRRERVDEYGWRNYGDLHADHEAVHHQGDESFISHYNNQYDILYGSLFQFLTTGDQRWQEIAAPLARHVIDIDIYHTDQDKSAYNHGQFWHTDHYRQAFTSSHRTYSARMDDSCGGGPSNENNYTSGLLHTYYLTGDQMAADAVKELAGWVISMDDGSRSLFALIDQGPTGLASQTVSPDFHHPGRGAGNSINALLDGYRLTADHHYLAKAEELIRRCIHPHDDIEALQLDQPEYRWSYLNFLQSLGNYLDLKVEDGEFDHSFYYAWASLLHYGRWMAEFEQPYQEIIDRMEIPTETWPAQDIRKCHVLHMAAQYSQDETERDRFRDKAEFFFHRCLEDTLKWPTSGLLRPLVLLTCFGPVHAFFMRHNPSVRIPPRRCDFGRPQPFTGQRRRMLTTLVRNGRTTWHEFARLIKMKLAQRMKR